MAVRANDGSPGQRWHSGPTMAVRANDGSPGQRWQSGPTMAFRTNDGSPGQRWQSGPMMAVRANAGSPGQRWQLPHHRNPDNWPPTTLSKLLENCNELGGLLVGPRTLPGVPNPCSGSNKCCSNPSQIENLDNRYYDAELIDFQDQQRKLLGGCAPSLGKTIELIDPFSMVNST